MEHYQMIRKNRSEKKDQLVIREKDGVVYLTFPLMDQYPELICGFSTRLGGVGSGYTGTMNLSFSRQPEKEIVLENHRRLAQAAGYREECLVFSKQTHTVNVKAVTKEDQGKGLLRELDYDDVDGLITNEKGLVLMTFYADCVPLMIYDPVHQAIASSHSGWRGTVADMGGNTLDRMKEEYGTRPEDVIAVIGPSICQECYEVSEDVILEVKRSYDESLWGKLFYQKENQKENGKYQLNLWEACRQNFLRKGVREECISIPDICTCCNPDLLFSHRASQGKRGNLAAFIGLR